MSLPTTTAQWQIKTQGGFDSLELEPSAPIPALGDHDCLVKIEAASLNYRDLLIAKGKYQFPISLPIVPGSDGAGTILATGPRVTRFKAGDQVCTLFNQAHVAGELEPAVLKTGLGGSVDGTLRQYGVFEEGGLVASPANLSSVEASTLSCAAVTAWNALYGLQGGGKAVKAGDTVLTQGTGGVSMFAVQFARAAGARVIATTSSAAKAERLKALGAHHVVNYREDGNWGETAKRFTRGGMGVDHVIEVSGPASMAQSLKAVRMGGVITIIGFLGGMSKDQPGFLDCLTNQCVVRGVMVGSRSQFDDMNRAIEANHIRPVVDDRLFSLDQASHAYQYMWEQKHFGKLVVKID